MSGSEQVDGAGLVRTAMTVLYKRALKDPLLRPYFERITVEDLRHDQRAFMSSVLGGEEVLVGGSLAGMGLTDEAYDAIVEHVRLTLFDLGLSRDDVSTVGKVLEDLRPTIVPQPVLSGREGPAGP